jgi:hypothetical protein
LSNTQANYTKKKKKKNKGIHNTKQKKPKNKQPEERSKAASAENGCAWRKRAVTGTTQP